MTIILLPFFLFLLLLKLLNSVLRMIARLVPFFISGFGAITIFLVSITGFLVTPQPAHSLANPQTPFSTQFSSELHTAVQSLPSNNQQPAAKIAIQDLQRTWQVALTPQDQLAILKAFPNPNKSLIEKLQKMHQQNPAHRDVLFDLSLLLKDENPIQAQEYLRQAKQLDPNASIFR